MGGSSSAEYAEKDCDQTFMIFTPTSEPQLGETMHHRMRGSGFDSW
jgi:hypothetical protein